MAVDRWFIGGGAEHTPESARRALYASTSGAEGVGGIHDLKVVPLAVPGQGVRVQVGSALIRSHYIGGETQTYMGTVYSEETVGITPTGSGQTRHDLVVFRVEDPYAAGSTYTAPAEGDRATAPYIHVRVISGVPAGTTRLQDVPGYQNDTAVTLARINFPVSTGTVTTGMITDLRKIAQPRQERVLKTRPLGLTEVSDLVSTTAEGQVWPGIPTDLWGPIDIPEWATHVQAIIRWNGILFTGNIWGDTWVRLGEGSNAVATESTRFDAVSTVDANHRNVTEAVGTIAIPTSLRGTSSRFYPMGKRDPAAPGATIARMDKNSNVVLDIEFSERAV